MSIPDVPSSEQPSPQSQAEDPGIGAWRGWRLFLSIWSGFNGAAFATAAFGMVSLWPPRGTVGTYYSGPGDGLFFLFFVMAPGAFTFLINTIVLLVIAFTRSGRDSRVAGWWGLVMAAWIVGLAVLTAMAPSARPLPS